MWTLDDCIEVTPLGRYVARLRREDLRLGELQHPGRNCSDPRVRRIAARVEEETNNLRGALREELSRCGALPLESDPEELPPPHLYETRTDCDCGAPTTVIYFGRRFCQGCVDFMEAQEGHPCLKLWPG